MNSPEKCQHRRVDNETWQCVECGTRMVTQHMDAETVLSAPNAAGCNNPACLTALEDGSYDETNPPAGCTNRYGFYVPDRGRERTVVIGYKYSYECDRCHTNGDTVFTRDHTIWGCGQVHRGDYVAAGAAVGR